MFPHPRTEAAARFPLHAAQRDPEASLPSCRFAPGRRPQGCAPRAEREPREAEGAGGARRQGDRGADENRRETSLPPVSRAGPPAQAIQHAPVALPQPRKCIIRHPQTALHSARASPLRSARGHPPLVASDGRALVLQTLTAVHAPQRAAAGDASGGDSDLEDVAEPSSRNARGGAPKPARRVHHLTYTPRAPNAHPPRTQHTPASITPAPTETPPDRSAACIHNQQRLTRAKHARLLALTQADDRRQRRRR